MMKKIKLTRKWKNQKHTYSMDSSSTNYGNIYLQCRLVLWTNNEWIGSASLRSIHKRTGPIRQSVRAAQQDAERLAVELLRDIRDGTKVLMDQYGMGEDD